MRCRPTNRAPKRPQNSLIFWQIALDTSILEFWHLWALRTKPGEAADLSIMASWPGMVESAVIFFRTLAHSAPRQTSAPNYMNG
jgi:hypothetical protein